MHKPSVCHWRSVKQISCYLTFFVSNGLYISKRAILSLHGFIDADWGDHDDKESVSLL